MNKIGILIVVILLVAGIVLSWAPKNSVWHLPNKDVSLILADTEKSREVGLGGRDSIPDTSAMLFVFDKPDIYPFWMKDMKFPIDIIWLDESYRIIHIESDLSPATYPVTYQPTEKSLFVLETSAYFAQKNNLKVGDILKISLHK